MAKENNKDKYKNRRRIAASVRQLMAEAVACDVPDDLFAGAAEKIEGFTEKLAVYKRRKRVYKPFTEDSMKRDGKYISYREMEDLSPVTGLSNPVSPPVRVYTEDNITTFGEVTFPVTFEGPPGLVHGGYVAAVLDEFLGIAQTFAGVPGVTGSLKIRFRSPCPLNTLLFLEGKVTSVEEGKKFVTGVMKAGDTMIADSEAVFIIIQPDDFQMFATARNKER